MRLLARLLEPKAVACAHCDLPCGVYDPAQARIEAESVKAIDEKYQQNTDPEFRARALIIKEQRSELVKHHLWVLWTDYFKPPHFEKYPQLHTLFNEATKLAGAQRHEVQHRPGRRRPVAGQDRRDQQDLLGDQAGLIRPAVTSPTHRRRGRDNVAAPHGTSGRQLTRYFQGNLVARTGALSAGRPLT